MIQALPPPISPQIAITVAARQRGWSYGKIALALGISAQAIEQRIDGYERYYGPVDPTTKSRLKSKRKSALRIPMTCRFCKTTSWTTEHHDYNKYYCSVECFRSDCCINDGVLLQAMDMRITGATWKHIGKLLGFTVQSFQRRIWVHLASEGMLTPKVVGQYWYPYGLRKSSRTGWLERSTGLKPK